jgi:DNA replication and repair protein RecF
VGPHLDDLQLTLGGGTAKERASQGQHRALVLALKLVEIEELASELGEAPVLLLDDMSSELDAGRTRQLFEAVRRLDGQVILTSTSPPDALAPALGGPRDFRFQTVRGGTLAPPEHLPTGESPGPRRDST